MNQLNLKISIYLLYDACFDIQKVYFKEGFPPEIYEVIMCIQAAYFLSHKIRKNTRVFLAFIKDNLVISYFGNKLKYLGPDERSIGTLLMKALEKKESLGENRKIQSSPGIWIQKKKFIDIISEFGNNRNIFIANKNSSAGLGEITQNELILMISNLTRKDFGGKIFLSNLNPSEFGTEDLPEKMRSYLTILKFYSIIDNLL